MWLKMQSFIKISGIFKAWQLSMNREEWLSLLSGKFESAYAYSLIIIFHNLDRIKSLP